jgi:hypothetical protein
MEERDEVDTRAFRGRRVQRTEAARPRWNVRVQAVDVLKTCRRRASIYQVHHWYAEHILSSMQFSGSNSSLLRCRVSEPEAPKPR